MSDDYTGMTHYASELRRDYCGAWAKKPLKRNLQEVASPLNDPQPVDPYRGPTYEASGTCLGDVAPTYVGLTNVRTSISNMAYQVLIDGGIGSWAIGCNFEVQ